MKIKYMPNFGFHMLAQQFNWGEDRISIRKRLKNKHKEDNRRIEMAQFFGGDTSNDIEQRRDIYQDINGGKNYLFLSYDKEDKLSELEIHQGIEITIKGIDLRFQYDISKYLEAFGQIGEKFSETEEGNYLFENLKMTIANSESAGGEGNGLSYFYSAKNIDHLIEK